MTRISNPLSLAAHEIVQCRIAKPPRGGGGEAARTSAGEAGDQPQATKEPEARKIRFGEMSGKSKLKVQHKNQSGRNDISDFFSSPSPYKETGFIPKLLVVIIS